MRIIWFVRYGPDASHLAEAKPFNKLRDAREFARNLPLTPTGFERPFKIERFEYSQSTVYGDVVRISEVSANHRTGARKSSLERAHNADTVYTGNVT